MTSPESALFLAAKAGHDDDIEELAKTNVNLNATDQLGNSALHYSAAGGHKSCVQALVKSRKVNVNAQNNVGDTPLHKAAFRPTKNTVDLINILLAAGADTQIKNKEGQTPQEICRDAEAKSLLVPQGEVPGFDPDLADDNNSSDDDDDDEDEDD